MFAIVNRKFVCARVDVVSSFALLRNGARSCHRLLLRPAPRMLIVPALEDGQFGAYQGALRRCELTSPEVSRDHIIDRIDVRRENLITWYEAKGWPIKGPKTAEVCGARGLRRSWHPQRRLRQVNRKKAPGGEWRHYQQMKTRRPDLRTP